MGVARSARLRVFVPFDYTQGYGSPVLTKNDKSGKLIIKKGGETLKQWFKNKCDDLMIWYIIAREIIHNIFSSEPFFPRERCEKVNGQFQAIED